VPTAPDEKWDELSKEQRKWRYKAFPHYDALYETRKYAHALQRERKFALQKHGK
jgi:hypothetical protein